MLVNLLSNKSATISCVLRTKERANVVVFKMSVEDCDESQRRKRKREKHKEREGKGKRQRKASSKVQEEQAAVVSSTYQSSKPLSLKIKLGQGSSKRNRYILVLFSVEGMCDIKNCFANYLFNTIMV